jgi:hypothetical protein
MDYVKRRLSSATECRICLTVISFLTTPLLLLVGAGALTAL